MSHNDGEDNFPLATALAGKRKAEEGSVGAAAATARKQNTAKTQSKSKNLTKKAAAGSARVVETKQRMASKQRTPNFAVGEDIALCKAYVNCTLNPLVGNDQKAEVFWNAVLKAYNDINSNYSADDEVIVVERESASLRNRFQRAIAKQTKEWNPFSKGLWKLRPAARRRRIGYPWLLRNTTINMGDDSYLSTALKFFISFRSLIL
jgi:hypothetical protein